MPRKRRQKIEHGKFYVVEGKRLTEGVKDIKHKGWGESVADSLERLNAKDLEIPTDKQIDEIFDVKTSRGYPAYKQQLYAMRAGAKLMAEGIRQGEAGKYMEMIFKESQKNLTL